MINQSYIYVIMMSSKVESHNFHEFDFSGLYKLSDNYKTVVSSERHLLKLERYRED
jgi:hypothetical protein